MESCRRDCSNLKNILMSMHFSDCCTPDLKKMNFQVLNDF